MSDLRLTTEQLKLRDAILALPDRQRAAFLLTRYDHMPKVGIALALNCTEEEARQALVDAIVTLQKVVEAQESAS